MIPVWEDLVTVALVGTERRGLPAVAAPDGTDLAGATDEDRVLAAAAALAAWRTAGWEPTGPAPPVPEPAPVDTRPACSARAAQLLDLLLAPGTTFADTRGLVGHWLDSCAAAGQRPPHRLLVPLLARATVDTPLRAATAAAVAERGHWLAARRPDWAWAAGAEGAPDPGRWAAATRAERVVLLRALRAADPAAGRALLVAERDGLSAAERAELVEALATGLGPGDAGLLDDLLDDRAAGVRVAAAALLDHLPDSPRARRLGDALVRLVWVSGRVRRRVEVELPVEDDPAFARDLPGEARRTSPEIVLVAGQLGLGAVSLGRRASLLARLVAAAPLSAWARAGAEPAAVVAAAEERTELVIGLAAAVMAQADRQWAPVLFARLPLPGLVPLVPAPVAEAVLAGRAERASDAELAAVVAAAAHLADRWSEGFSAAMVGRFRRVENGRVVAVARDLLATRLHPAVTAAVEAWRAGLPEGDHGRRRPVGQLHQALTMRRTISEEFPV